MHKLLLMNAKDTIQEQQYDASFTSVDELLENAQEGDIVYTTTLVNFSFDVVTALHEVTKVTQKGVRVVSICEDFDSSRLEDTALLNKLSLLKQVRINALASVKENRMAGIRRASALGHYNGRPPLSVKDFPQFEELKNEYETRKINKGEFAVKLGVSRPTLDKLLKAM